MKNKLSVERFDGSIQTREEAAYVAKILYESGNFTDLKSAAQAMVKIQAGAELGFSPFASITGIHFIQGKPKLSSALIASLIKRSKKYNYRVLQSTALVCEIEWLEHGVKQGVFSYTIEQAKRAGTTNLEKFPEDMLFARALTKGAIRYCPDLIYASVGDIGVVDDDMDGTVDGEYMVMPSSSSSITSTTSAAGTGTVQGGLRKEPLGNGAVVMVDDDGVVSEVKEEALDEEEVQVKEFRTLLNDDVITAAESIQFMSFWHNKVKNASDGASAIERLRKEVYRRKGLDEHGNKVVSPSAEVMPVEEVAKVESNNKADEMAANASSSAAVEEVAKVEAKGSPKGEFGLEDSEVGKAKPKEPLKPAKGQVDTFEKQIQAAVGLLSEEELKGFKERWAGCDRAAGEVLVKELVKLVIERKRVKAQAADPRVAPASGLPI